MDTRTENIIKTILASDRTISPQETQIVLQVLKGKSPLLNPEKREVKPELLTRKQVAVMIGRSLPMVDIYARRGIFKRVYLMPNERVDGGKRIRLQAQGISRASVVEAIQRGFIKQN